MPKRSQKWIQNQMQNWTSLENWSHMQESFWAKLQRFTRCKGAFLFPCLFLLVCGFGTGCTSSGDADVLLDPDPRVSEQESGKKDADSTATAEGKTPSAGGGNQKPAASSAAATGAQDDPWKLAENAREIEAARGRDSGKNLPFPAKPSYYFVKGFMEEYRDVYLRFMPLTGEYKVYFQTLNAKPPAGISEMSALRVRVRDNFDRSHWIFMGAIQECMEFLISNSKGQLQVDKEVNFAARMRVIAFMAQELTEMTSDDKYQKFAQQVYIQLSEKYLNRVLRERSGGQP